jgi:hypothetical protein
MNEVTQKLEKLEAIFKAANAPILQHFNPGLPEDEIIAFFTKNNIPVHVDLIYLYQWHNGVKSIYDQPGALTEIKPMCSFPNLDEMLALRNDFLSYDYLEVENPHEYIPILSGGEDDMHLLRISSGRIYYLSPDCQIYCEPVFNSLTSLLNFTLNCYETNVLKMHPTEGLLIVDEGYWELEADYKD